NGDVAHVIADQPASAVADNHVPSGVPDGVAEYFRHRCRALGGEDVTACGHVGLEDAEPAASLDELHGRCVTRVDLQYVRLPFSQHEVDAVEADEAEGFGHRLGDRTHPIEQGTVGGEGMDTATVPVSACAERGIAVE